MLSLFLIILTVGIIASMVCNSMNKINILNDFKHFTQHTITIGISIYTYTQY